MKKILHSNRSIAYGAQRRTGNCRSAASGVFALAVMSFASPGWADTLRLVALGDSLTQGYGLETEAGFVPQLERWLRDEAGLDVEVINAGVSGDTTAGGLARMDWTLAEPMDAMLVTLGGNDLLRGIDPASSRANLDAILARLVDEGIPAMLVGLPAPGNYGPEYRDDFEAMYTELSTQYDVPLYPDFLAPMTEKAEAGQRFTDLMQSDHIHPNAEGVALIVEGIGPEIAAFLDKIARESS